MNLPHSPRSGSALLLSLIAAAGLSLTSLSAQSVATAPVGAVSSTVPLGLSSVGYTLLNPNLATANCTANTTSGLTLSGISNVGALLTSGLPYYVEAVSGPMEGERFDVDTNQTINAGNGTIVLNAASPNNTTTLTANEAVGSSFALRQHVTLQQIGSQFTTALVAGTNAGNSDQIRLYNPATGVFTIYFLRSTGWVTGSAPSNNVVIPPGVGFFFFKRTAPATMVATGGVRINAFSMPMNVGLSLRSVGYPVPYSPAMLGATVANGWTGANSAGSADQIRIFNASTGLFTNYFMRTTSAWVQGSNTVTTTPIIAPEGAYMLSRKTTDTDYILTEPFTL